MANNASFNYDLGVQGAPNYAPRGAPEVREASLRNKADECAGYLQTAHSLLDELETAVHGPTPRDLQKDGTANGSASHPGLRVVLDDNGAKAAGIVSRLQTLIGSL